MNSIEQRLVKLQHRLAWEREQREMIRVTRLRVAELDLQQHYAQSLQRRKNQWDRYWRKCRRMGWPLPPLNERPVSDADEIKARM